MPKIMFAATRKTKVKIRIVIRAITVIYPNLKMALTIVKYIYYKNLYWKTQHEFKHQIDV